MKWFKWKEAPKSPSPDREQEAVHNIIQLSKHIKGRRLAAVFYTILADRSDLTDEELEQMSNRLSAAAWEKRRIKSTKS